VFFMRPGEETATELFMSRFETAPVDQEVVDVTGALYRMWNPSHGIDANDAFLAATAMRAGGKSYTLNRKHYPMPDVLVEQAW
jgi:predicted nucleic acid-binding protein